MNAWWENHKGKKSKQKKTRKTKRLRITKYTRGIVIPFEFSWGTFEKKENRKNITRFVLHPFLGETKQNPNWLNCKYCTKIVCFLEKCGGHCIMPDTRFPQVLRILLVCVCTFIPQTKNFRSLFFLPILHLLRFIRKLTNFNSSCNLHFFVALSYFSSFNYKLSQWILNVEMSVYIFFFLVKYYYFFSISGEKSCKNLSICIGFFFVWI